MHFLYFIYSPATDKFYVGETNNVPERMKLHNSYKGIKSITGAASDWELKLIFNCKSKKEAVYLQKFIKRKKSRKFYEEILERPEELGKLLEDLKG